MILIIISCSNEKPNEVKSEKINGFWINSNAKKLDASTANMKDYLLRSNHSSHGSSETFTIVFYSDKESQEMLVSNLDKIYSLNLDDVVVTDSLYNVNRNNKVVIKILNDSTLEIVNNNSVSKMLRVSKEHIDSYDKALELSSSFTNSIFIAGNYRDSFDRNYEFKDNGVAIFPTCTFSYSLFMSSYSSYERKLNELDSSDIDLVKGIESIEVIDESTNFGTVQKMNVNKIISGNIQYTNYVYHRMKDKLVLFFGDRYTNSLILTKTN